MSTFIIAEAGVNHNGSMKNALALVDLAKEAGASAVKFQTFSASKVASSKAPKAKYQMAQTNKAESQIEMLKRLELSAKMHRQIIDHCKKRKIQFMSTPFDVDSLDLLVKKFKLDKVKLASGEVTNPLLLLHAARSNKKIILSTGMSSLAEVEFALGVLAFGMMQAKATPSASEFVKAFQSEKGRSLVRKRVALLHCTTEYPAPFSDVNLKAMDTLKLAFGVDVGLSDHTPGISMPIAAVARGAQIIEKHFTLDKNMPGPDHQASLAPEELIAMVRGIREVEVAIGDGAKVPAQSEIANRQIVRRSLVAAKDISVGEKFSVKNLTLKRPGSGVPSSLFWDYVGTKANRAYQKDEMIDL